MCAAFSSLFLQTLTPHLYAKIYMYVQTYTYINACMRMCIYEIKSTPQFL